MLEFDNIYFKTKKNAFLSSTKKKLAFLCDIDANFLCMLRYVKEKDLFFTIPFHFIWLQHTQSGQLVERHQVVRTVIYMDGVRVSFFLCFYRIIDV